MNIADSYALWGLLGLAIPILIHLLSKKEKSIVKFGSLKFLQATESQSAKSIQLSQFPLLLLRMLLVGAVCFLMAQPLIDNNESQVSYWVEEGLMEDGSYDTVLPLEDEDVAINKFSFDGTSNDGVHQFKSAWTMIDKLNDSRDNAVVFSHSLQKHFVGRPVELENHVSWKVLPKLQTEQSMIRNGKELPWTITSSSDSTTVESQLTEAGHKKESLSPLKLEFVINEEGEESKQIKEIIDLSEDLLPYPISWVEATGNADWKIIVGDESESERGPLIQWLPSDRLLTIELTKSDQLLLKGKLSKDALLKSNLPVIIASALNKNYTSIYTYDNRVLLPDYVKATPENKEVLAGINNTKQSPINNLWWIVVLLLIGLERIYSYQLSKS